MASRRVDGKKAAPTRPPATTPEGREQQLIGAAIDLAEKQLLDGTASSQVVTHYLKLGSSREHLEQQRMKHEIELMEVKRAAMESAQNVEALYAEAMKAFSTYSGNPELETGDDDDY